MSKDCESMKIEELLNKIENRATYLKGSPYTNDDILVKCKAEILSKIAELEEKITNLESGEEYRLLKDRIQRLTEGNLKLEGENKELKAWKERYKNGCQDDTTQCPFLAEIAELEKYNRKLLSENIDYGNKVAELQLSRGQSAIEAMKIIKSLVNETVVGSIFGRAIKKIVQDFEKEEGVIK